MACLIASLKENEFAAENACGVIKGLGSDAKPVLPALWKLLEGSSGSLRVRAAAAIWQISHDEKAIEILGRELYKTENCSWAAYQLKIIGKPAKSAVPFLLAVLHDPDDQNCESAASALLKIDPKAAAAAGIR